MLSLSHCFLPSEGVQWGNSMFDPDNDEVSVTQTAVPNTDNSVADIPETPADQFVDDDSSDEDSLDGDTSQNKASESDSSSPLFNELAQKKGFKSPDDLAKAYQELERHSTKTGMRRSTSPNIKAGQLEQVQKDLQYLKTKEEVRDLVSKFPDAPELMDQIENYLRKYPDHPYETAYKFVKHDVLTTKVKQEKEHIVEQKQRVQTQVASRRSTVTTNIDELLADKSVPLSEIERMLS